MIDATRQIANLGLRRLFPTQTLDLIRLRNPTIEDNVPISPIPLSRGASEKPRERTRAPLLEEKSTARIIATLFKVDSFLPIGPAPLGPKIPTPSGKDSPDRGRHLRLRVPLSEGPREGLPFRPQLRERRRRGKVESMIESGALGKKVLFLYPPPVLTDVVEELARREFEVYLISNHAKTGRYLASQPESIVFVNIDEGLEEPQWEAWIRQLRSSDATKGVGVGILSLNDDQELKNKYLMELQVPCGYVTLKLGASKSADILARTLEANEARGKRKFVRAMTMPGTTLCAANLDGDTLRGEIRDFSIAGMAVQFEGGAALKAGTVLRNLALTIKGGRISVDGVIVAHRNLASTRSDEEPRASTVIMFDPNSMDDAKREKLRSLILKVNQAELDKVFEGL